MATVASGLNSGSGFSNSDTVTSTTLNNHVNDATVTDIVNDDVASNAAVAVTKLATITSQNVLGNIGSGNASVPIVGTSGILKNDDSLGTSDTQGATQGNIKAYVDAQVDTYALKYSGSTGTFNVTAGSYSDLDISSVVGSNRALVIMDIYDGSSGTGGNFFIRTKGSSIDRHTTAGGNIAGYGIGGVTVQNGSVGGTVAVITSTSGVLEYTSDVSSNTVDYTIQAYQVLK